MVVYNPDAPKETREEYRQRLWERDVAFIGPRQRPNWNLFYERGVWPDPSFYEMTFIGPRPPPDKFWKRSARPADVLGLLLFTDYMILPDPTELGEWIRLNATTPVHLSYSWEVKGRRRLKHSLFWVFTPDGDSKENSRFLRMIFTAFDWLEDERAFSVLIHLCEDKSKADDFRVRFPRRYKEQ